MVLIYFLIVSEGSYEGTTSFLVCCEFTLSEGGLLVVVRWVRGASTEPPGRVI